MNGKLQSSDVKNETPYNIPLSINDDLQRNFAISLWHTYADEHYRVIWPRDKKKPLIANSWVAVYTVQGCGKILLKEWRTNNTAWQLYYILKANGYSLLSL